MIYIKGRKAKIFGVDKSIEDINAFIEDKQVQTIEILHTPDGEGMVVVYFEEEKTNQD